MAALPPQARTVIVGGGIALLFLPAEMTRHVCLALTNATDGLLLHVEREDAGSALQRGDARPTATSP